MTDTTPPTATTTTTTATRIAPKQETPPENEHINLRVCAPDGGEVYFKIKKTTSFKKLMDAYCQRQSINPANIRFLYDGQRLKEEQNPSVVCVNTLI